MPKPVLQAMVLADHIYQDRVTGKFVIAGTFSSVYMASKNDQKTLPDGRQVVKGPVSRAGSPYLYLALVDVHNEVRLDVKFVELMDAHVIFETGLTVTSKDPLAVAEYAIPMPPLPVSKPGDYSLDLIYDNEILGSWRIKAVQSGSPSETQ